MNSNQKPVLTEEENMMEFVLNQSSYHFDPDRQDYSFDTVHGLGRFVGDWTDEVEHLIETSRPITLASRGYWGGKYPPIVRKPGDPNNNDYVREWYDKHCPPSFNYDTTVVSNKSTDIGPKIRKMIDMFKLGAPYTYGVHVQKTGQMFPYHIDYFPKNTYFYGLKNVIRFNIMLTDWHPGQFYGFGNHVYTRWKAGDFSTFNYLNTPHFSANACYQPKVNLLLTGIRTQETLDFFDYARSVKEIEI